MRDILKDISINGSNARYEISEKKITELFLEKPIRESQKITFQEVGSEVSKTVVQNPKNTMQAIHSMEYGVRTYESLQAGQIQGED